jgi:hypothetical protein
MNVINEKEDKIFVNPVLLIFLCLSFVGKGGKQKIPARANNNTNTPVWCTCVSLNSLNRDGKYENKQLVDPT